MCELVGCQVPTSAEVCVLAGVLCSNLWVRSLALDGNPLGEEGLEYLYTAMLRNRCLERVSLKRCGLGERAGALLLRLLDEKPGVEVDCVEGNHFGDDTRSKVTKHQHPPFMLYSTGYRVDMVLRCAQRPWLEGRGEALVVAGCDACAAA